MALPSKYSIAHAVTVVGAGGHPVRPVDVNGVALDDPNTVFSIAHPVLETDANGVVTTDSTKVVSTPRIVTVSTGGTPVITVDSSGNALGAAFGSTGGGGTSLGGTGTLSAPALDYPSSQTAQPTIGFHPGVDWQSGDVAKLALSASPSMSSPTILTHTITDADITAGAFSFPIPTLSALTYFQAFGSHSGTDSQYLSNIVAWGDTTAPVITTSASQSVTETSALAVALTGTDAGGIASWAIASGADQLWFQITGSTLQWVNNGYQTYSTPQDQGSNNIYNVNVVAIDYAGNVSAPLAMAITVNQIDRLPDAYSFTSVTNASLSTVYTSNTVTISGLEPGFQIPSTFSGPGTYSKNGGAFVSTSPFTAQNGDTFQLKTTSGSADSMSVNLTLAIGSGSATWSVATPGSSAVLASTTGTSKSQYENVASPFFQYVTNATLGAMCPVRATIPAANTKFHMEWTVNSFQASGGNSYFFCGFDDGTIDCHSPGYLAALPGGSGGAKGIILKTQKGGSSDVYVNGAPVSSGLPSMTDGDTIAFDVDTSANTVRITHYRGGTTTVYTFTLTSQIPSSWYALGGGGTGNGTAATGSSDSATANFGAASWLVTPQSGYGIYA